MSRAYSPCPLCGAALQIVGATTEDVMHPGHHIATEPLPTRPRETTIVACTGCELILDLGARAFHGNEGDDGRGCTGCPAVSAEAGGVSRDRRHPRSCFYTIGWAHGPDRRWPMIRKGQVFTIAGVKWKVTLVSVCRAHCEARIPHTYTVTDHKTGATKAITRITLEEMDISPNTPLDVLMELVGQKAVR